MSEMRPRLLSRIQRRRTAGWRMPEGSVYVGRPTRWGNPFTVMNGGRQGWLIYDDRNGTSGGFIASFASKGEAHAYAVKQYCAKVIPTLDLAPLRDHDLACWCPPTLACHADSLLDAANRRPR